MHSGRWLEQRKIILGERSLCKKMASGVHLQLQLLLWSRHAHYELRSRFFDNSCLLSQKLIMDR